MARCIGVAPPPDYQILTAEVVARVVRSIRLADPDILWVEDVAERLGCTRDFVYRIPYEKLPYAKIGKRNVYLRKYVLRYVEACLRPSGTDIRPAPQRDFETILADVEGQVIYQRLDGALERHRRRTTR